MSGYDSLLVLSGLYPVALFYILNEPLIQQVYVRLICAWFALYVWNMWNNCDEHVKKRPLLLIFVHCRKRQLLADHCGGRASCVCPLCTMWSGLIWHKVMKSFDWRTGLLPLPWRFCLGSTSLSTHLRRQSVIHEFTATWQPDMSGQPDRLTAGEMERFFLNVCRWLNKLGVHDIPKRDRQTNTIEEREINKMSLHTLLFFVVVVVVVK